MVKIIKSNFFLIIILLFLSSTVFTKDTNKNESINFMSFNIHSSYDSNEYYNSWSKRKNLVIQTIRHINPDVIAFQDVSEEQLKYLEDELPDYKSIGKSNGIEKEAIYNPIFYKKDYLDILEENTFWLSENPSEVASFSWDSKSINTCTWANFKYGRYQFIVASTQFDKESEKSRKESTNLILNTFKSKKLDNIILAGTFNTDLNNKDMESFNSKEILHLSDAFKKANIINGTSAKTTKHDYKGFQNKDSKRLDYIFTSQNMYITTAEIITYHEKSNYPSSHYPLNIKFAFNPNSGDLNYSSNTKSKNYSYSKNPDSVYSFQNTSFIDEYKIAIKNEKKEAQKRAQKYKEKKMKEKKNLD